jgi:hypothetical protein
MAAQVLEVSGVTVARDDHMATGLRVFYQSLQPVVMQAAILRIEGGTLQPAGATQHIQHASQLDCAAPHTAPVDWAGAHPQPVTEWCTQLPTEGGLMVSTERRWPGSGAITCVASEVRLSAGGRLGFGTLCRGWTGESPGSSSLEAIWQANGQTWAVFNRASADRQQHCLARMPRPGEPWLLRSCVSRPADAPGTLRSQ